MILKSRLARLERLIRPNAEHCLCPGIHPRILVLDTHGTRRRRRPNRIPRANERDAAGLCSQLEPPKVVRWGLCPTWVSATSR